MIDAIVAMSCLLVDGVLIVDRGGVVVFANPAFEAMVGVDAGSIVGSSAEAIIGSFGVENGSNVQRTAGTDRPFLVGSASIGQVSVVVCRSMPARPTPDRLAELESIVRNISWELQSLTRPDTGGASRRGSSSESGLRALSRREREILDAYLVELSVSGVAAQLHVSSHTVQSHLKAIYRKLGVRSKVELVRLLSSS